MNRNGRNYVINIGRQLGSGGKEIGEKLAARLGIDFYDKELIKLASEETRKLLRESSVACLVCVSLLSVKELFRATTV